jgi:RNA 2',3'-cyclic 3'-phosphodiesterase
MRLFVALTLPPQVVEELWMGTAAVREGAPELRWTRPEQWHLTLAFLGDVDHRDTTELPTRLARAARRHAALSLRFGGGGRFGNRVLWIPVHGDCAELCRLADAVRAAARRCGLPVEHRRYRPHLTLARANGTTDLRPLVDQLTTCRTRQWPATRLDLMRSTLAAGPGGTALHEPIAGWALGG